jgi:hypothetical protein
MFRRILVLHLHIMQSNQSYKTNYDYRPTSVVRNIRYYLGVDAAFTLK